MDDIDLRTTLGAVPIERDTIIVTGPEAITFLQGQLSQDVEPLEVGESAWSLLLQPTGKVDAWLRVTRIGREEAMLDVDAGFGEAVAARLRRFKLRTRADIEVVAAAGYAVRGPGAEALDLPDARPARWPGVAGVDILHGAPPAALVVASRDALDALRIEVGVPAMGAELTEATIPAEAGQWVIDASVSFTKGCFTGQELVARIDSRGGNVPRPVRGLVVDGNPVLIGAVVRLAEADVGTVTSSARSMALGSVALAPLARSVAAGARVDLRTADGGSATATVVDLPMR